MNRLAIILFLNGLVGMLHAQTTVNYNVYLRSNMVFDTMWDGNILAAYGMSNALSSAPKIPSFTIFCNEGDTVVLNALSISQGDHHTIHLHGLDVDTRNDGDPATSFWLSHLQDTTYTFIANHAGTYLFHCHVGDVVHVQMGMYGLVIVRAAGGVNTAWTDGPMFHKDYAWLCSEMDEYWHDSIPTMDPVMDTMHIPPYLPDYFLINGKSETELTTDSTILITGQVNEKIYLRLANIGFNDNVFVFPSSLNAKVIDSDGRPLPSQFDLDTITVSPGERYGVMLNPDAEFTSTVEVHYVNMNTNLDLNVQYIPVSIDGFLKVDNLQSESDLVVYPQPANDLVTVVWKLIEPEKLILTNVLGQTILESAIERNTFSKTFDISTLPKGLYILNAIQKDNKSMTHIVVE